MHPELKRGVRKLKLMGILGSDPVKIYKEGKKYTCKKCSIYYSTKNCLGINDGTNTFLDIDICHCVRGKLFTLFNCWRPK